MLRKTNPRHLIVIASLTSGLFASEMQAQEEVGHFDTDKRHHLSIVTAGTSVPAEDETAFTLGLDYEYRLTERVGLGWVAEHAFGELDATTVLAVADVHLWRGLALQIGPGFEVIEGDVFAAGRIGMLYEVELDNGITLSPQLHYDIGEESSVVFGVAIGRAF